jgi:pimeloyl-ACP methyl ester carboxylesterase
MRANDHAVVGCEIDTGISWRRAVAIVIVLGLGGCSTLSSEQAAPATASMPTACVPADNCFSGATDDAAGFLVEAHDLARRAARYRSERTAIRFWSRCAATAYRALSATQPADGEEAAALATHCTDQFLQLALQGSSRGWSEGPKRIGDVELTLEFRQLSPHLNGPLSLTRAQDVPMDLYGGERFASPGFGVPLAVVTPRCDDRPLCQMLPPEGVFRWATAWIEVDPGRDTPAPRLVIADPLAVGPLAVGDRRYPLAVDTSADYAKGVQTSKLQRLGIWGLLGGDEVGRRAGLYLLEDYDPNKRPIVMIHGLGSSPLAWARLSNALWGSPDLRARFQIWHVVYQTNAPLLVTRRRVQGYLDAGWRVLDPEGDDPARAGIVLIGHSLGGVISRMLCVDSGDVLWSAAFTAPPSALRGDPADLALIESAFRFEHYPGVSRAIFIAAPHRGSPRADSGFGRLFRALVGRRAPELQSLRRLAQENPEAVREKLRESYLEARLNSISTLQVAQPVRRAGESLMPVAGIPYHTIAGVLPGRQPETDGVVPLASALLPGAASTLVVNSGHKVYESDEAVAEVLRILREDLAQRGDRTQP